jgi:hypothetical protein
MLKKHLAPRRKGKKNYLMDEINREKLQNKFAMSDNREP